ncbi:MAG TPA: AAA family ATPase [Candidatus Margulisiibacteriota bacterium]|nr:AAA family ATPase [Candidatus Margulisiibacteriota bacterium]
MGRIICIANQKGGVGKTTTAVNLSASLGLAGRSTLLIDIDPQASASSGVGLAKADGLPTAYEVIMGEQPATAAIRPAAVQSLSVLPSTRDLIGAEIELVPMIAREHRLMEALRSVRDAYDYLIIDCPPSLGLLTINGLTAADSLLVPLQCEYYALEGLSALLQTVELIRQRLNTALVIEGLLLTMFDTRNSLCHQVVEEVRRHFPREVFQTIIPRNVRLSESPSHGLPAVVYDPTSRGAEAYKALAQEILERNQWRKSRFAEESEVGGG